MKNQKPFLVSYDIFRRQNVYLSLYTFLAVSIFIFALMGAILLFLALNVPMDHWTWLIYLYVVLTGIYAVDVIISRHKAKKLSR
jgi:uncharacterized membrane protein YfcA